MRPLSHLYKEVVVGAVSQIARDSKHMEVGEHGYYLSMLVVSGGCMVICVSAWCVCVCM